VVLSLYHVVLRQEVLHVTQICQLIQDDINITVIFERGLWLWC
jgi:hypothetical protein